MRWKSTFREALVIVLTAVVVSGIVYGIRPDKISPDKTGPNTPGGTAAPASDETGKIDENTGYREISLEQARVLFDRPGTIFADSRHELDFSAGHIRDARHFFEEDQEVWLNAVLSETEPDTVIITYCDGDDCRLATDLAQLLVLNGFTRVYYLKNGWTRWREKGFPTATGKETHQTAE